MSGLMTPDMGAAPPAKAGRTVALKEILRIEDDGDKVVFDQTQKLFEAGGSLYCLNGPFIYQFDRNGRLVRRFGKKGQGPGECDYIGDFLVDGGTVVCFSSMPFKILTFGKDGNLLSDMKADRNLLYWRIGAIDGTRYGIRDEMKFDLSYRQRDGLIETPFSVYRLDGAPPKPEKIFDIPVLQYIKEGRWWRRIMLDVEPLGRCFFVLHSDTYRFDKIEASTGKLLKTITRDYKRVKAGTEETVEDKFSEGLKPPPLAYEFDIYNLAACGDRLWVFTSMTRKSGRERLVDVYDIEGKMVDSFYIAFPANGQRIWQGSIIMSADGVLTALQESVETGFVSIGRYKAAAD